MKLLKKSYMQRALAEEARGNYQEAAAFYSKAEEFEKVGEMFELVGNLAQSLAEQLTAYQQALRWYKLPEHVEPLAAKLANMMETDIRTDAKISPAERHRLPQIAEYYALAKQWNKAGKIYEELGMYDEATNMYVQGGAIEQIEQLAVHRTPRDHKAPMAQSSYEEGVAFYHLGQYDKACHALEQCVMLDARHTEAQALLNKLKQALQSHAVRRITLPLEEREYLVFGKQMITLGRKEDNDIVLPHTDVSRYHARIGLHKQTLSIQDLESSNGTRLNGLRIQKTATIQDRDVIGIGLSARFEVCLQQRGTGMSAILRPLEQQPEGQRRYILFTGDLLIGAESECGLPVRPLVPTSTPYLFKITYQQPYWYVSIHPHLTNVEFNGTPVEDYVNVTAGDTITMEGFTMLFG